jgi:hypothetical protein
LLAVLLVLLFAYLAARRAKDKQDPEESIAAIRSLDIEAFRNLVDPEEEAYLRAHLSAKAFRKTKRARAQAALAYVRSLSRASLQIARLGDGAQRNPDPAVAASGRQIVNSATYLRLRALQASASLMIVAAFPGLGPRPLRSLLDQYDHTTHLLQNHAGSERVRSQAS